MDKINLTAVAGGVVNIVHPGSGATFLYYAPTGSGAAGSIGITGDVETSDLIVAAGTTIILTGAFSGPEPLPEGADAAMQQWHAPRAAQASIF